MRSALTILTTIQDRHIQTSDSTITFWPVVLGPFVEDLVSACVKVRDGYNGEVSVFLAGTLVEWLLETRATGPIRTEFRDTDKEVIVARGEVQRDTFVASVTRFLEEIIAQIGSYNRSLLEHPFVVTLLNYVKTIR